MAGTVARVTEISASSETSFEDAINVGIDRATRSLRNVSSAWVKEQKITLDGSGNVAAVHLLVTFVLDDSTDLQIHRGPQRHLHVCHRAVGQRVHPLRVQPFGLHVVDPPAQHRHGQVVLVE